MYSRLIEIVELIVSICIDHILIRGEMLLFCAYSFFLSLQVKEFFSQSIR